MEEVTPAPLDALDGQHESESCARHSGELDIIGLLLEFL